MKQPDTLFLKPHAGRDSWLAITYTGERFRVVMYSASETGLLDRSNFTVVGTRPCPGAIRPLRELLDSISMTERERHALDQYCADRKVPVFHPKKRRARELPSSKRAGLKIAKLERRIRDVLAKDNSAFPQDYDTPSSGWALIGAALERRKKLRKRAQHEYGRAKLLTLRRAEFLVHYVSVLTLALEIQHPSKQGKGRPGTGQLKKLQVFAEYFARSKQGEKRLPLIRDLAKKFGGVTPDYIRNCLRLHEPLKKCLEAYEKLESPLDDGVPSNKRFVDSLLAHRYRYTG